MVGNRKELVSFLEDVASEAFYSNCSREEGEYVFECDENGVVEGVLAAYEERLTKFFCSEEEDEGDDVDPPNPAPSA